MVNKMIKQMTITDLKKELKQLDQKELIELVCTLYKSNPKNKELISANFLVDQYKMDTLEKYKHDMYQMFFPKNINKSLSLKSAKSLITEFKKIGDKEMVLDLMLFYVECGTEYTNMYGDINEAFYNSIASVFDDFVIGLNDYDSHSAYMKFEDRIERLISKAVHVGWGFGDYIIDTAYEIAWYGEDFEDDEEEC
jgi:hypothetical protein